MDNDLKILLMIATVVILVIAFMYGKKENLDAVSTPTNAVPTLPSEALQNIASVYANTTGQATFNNMLVTGNADVNGSLTISGNVKTKNAFTVNGIDIRDFGIGCVLSSISKDWKEYAYGGNGTTMNFVVGAHTLCDAGNPMNDKSDNIVVNPGYGVKLYANCSFKSMANTDDGDAVIENRDVKPVRIGFYDKNLQIEKDTNVGIYTYDPTLITIKTSSASILNNISSLIVYKL